MPPTAFQEARLEPLTRSLGARKQDFDIRDPPRIQHTAGFGRGSASSVEPPARRHLLRFQTWPAQLEQRLAASQGDVLVQRVVDSKPEVAQDRDGWALDRSHDRSDQPRTRKRRKQIA